MLIVCNFLEFGRYMNRSRVMEELDCHTLLIDISTWQERTQGVTVCSDGIFPSLRTLCSKEDEEGLRLSSSFALWCLYSSIYKAYSYFHRYPWILNTKSIRLYILADKRVFWFAGCIIKFQQWIFSKRIDLLKLFFTNSDRLNSHGFFKKQLYLYFTFNFLKSIQFRNGLGYLLFFKLVNEIFNVFCLGGKVLQLFESSFNDRDIL